jgi:hypothetical protein
MFKNLLQLPRPRPLTCQQEVLGLQIPVHHVHGVHILDGGDEDFEQIPGLLFCVGALLGDPVEELAARLWESARKGGSAG